MYDFFFQQIFSYALKLTSLCALMLISDYKIKLTCIFLNLNVIFFIRKALLHLILDCNLKIMENEQLEKEIIKFFKRNKGRGKAFTVRHFEKTGHSSSTVYYYLRKYERALAITSTSRSSPMTSSSAATAATKTPKTPVREPFSDASNRVSTPGARGSVTKNKSTPKVNTSKLALAVQLSGYSSKGNYALN